MQEQFSRTQGVFVIDVPVLVRGNVHLININFAVFDVGMAFFQAGLALAERFNLGSGKDDSAFISFFDEVIVPGFFVLGNDFD